MCSMQNKTYNITIYERTKYYTERINTFGLKDSMDEYLGK